jgi:hypothetical protein
MQCRRLDQTTCIEVSLVLCFLDAAEDSYASSSSVYLCLLSMKVIVISVKLLGVGILVYMESPMFILKRCVQLFNEEARHFIFEWAQ